MLAQGSKAPSFQLESSEDGKVSLASLAGKIVVLYFYPRDNTPGCTVEAQDFRDQHRAFLDAGAVVLGVSRDSIASHCKFRDKYGLPFPLLSDSDGATMTAYQAWGEKVMYGKKVTGVIRSTVVIDRGGKIAKHWPKVNVKGHAAEVLAFVQSLGGDADSKSDKRPGGQAAASGAKKSAAAKTVAPKPPAKKQAAKKQAAKKQPTAKKTLAKKPPVAKKQPAAPKPSAAKKQPAPKQAAKKQPTSRSAKRR